MPKKKKEENEEKYDSAHPDGRDDAEDEDAEVLGVELPPKLDKTIKKAKVDLSALDKLLTQEGLGQNARRKAKNLVKKAYGE